MEHGLQASRAARGQILVITLLAITLLAGLVFFVFNVGDQVNSRIQMQNAADAAAVSGAGWMARAMNVIAMDNVTEARLVSLAIVLDSVPLAAEMTVAENTGPDSIPRVLADQLVRGVPGSRGNFLAEGLRCIHEQMGPQTDSIRAIDERFDQRDERRYEGGFDVGTATRWPDGSLWRAAVAMDRLSRTLADSAGLLAQANAVRFGQENGAETTMLVPVLPRMPAAQGRFQDIFPLFTDHLEIVNSPSRGMYSQKLVRTDVVGDLASSGDLLRDIIYMGGGRWRHSDFLIPGGAIPDYAWPHRLGPFAGVYRWRDGISLRDDQWGVTGFNYLDIGYRTYGPLENALLNVLEGFGEMGGWDTTDRVAWTLRFPHHVRTIAKLKLAYMLGLDSPRDIQYPGRWITDFGQAKSFARDNPDQVAGIRYYRVSVDSKVRWDSPQWMAGDSTNPEVRTWFSWQLDPPADKLPSETRRQWGERQPLARWGFDPWTSPTRRYHWWEPSGPMVAPYVWVSQQQVSVRSYEHFNWLERPILDDQGKIVDYDYYTLYRATWWVWGGLEVRDPVEVSDPLGGADYDELPAVMLLDTTDEQCDWINVADGQAVRVRPFGYLALAARPDAATAWRQRFRSDNPSREGVAAVAQAKLFNAESWDLWTQGWQVQLAPVSEWTNWANTAEAGSADASLTGGYVSEDQAAAAGEYLRSLEGELTDEFLTH